MNRIKQLTDLLRAEQEDLSYGTQQILDMIDKEFEEIKEKLEETLVWMAKNTHQFDSNPTMWVDAEIIEGNLKQICI